MKTTRFIFSLLLAALLASCGTRDNRAVKLPEIKALQKAPAPLIIDSGFSEYIAGYTSGIIPARAQLEIRFTPEFAARCKREQQPLFDFKPEIRGRSSWKDEVTLVFTPAKPLDAGKSYTGTLNLGKLAPVPERLSLFPIRIQTVRKDFRVSLGMPLADDMNRYSLRGEITSSDYIDDREIEHFLKLSLHRKDLSPEWQHSDGLSHSFIIKNIERTENDEDLAAEWNGAPGGIKHKGSAKVRIPAKGKFVITDVIHSDGPGQRIDVVFSDPVDPGMESEGLFTFDPPAEPRIAVNSNIVSLFPSEAFTGPVKLMVDKAVRNASGAALGSTVEKSIDFTTVAPAIELAGNGVIVPSSDNLIFPFRAANLRAVDMRIIKIHENNLPRFLQENDLDRGYSLKRFGRPVWSGRVDLIRTPGMSTNGWNLFTIDLSDYIDVEPGVLYKISLGMRRSYSLYPCGTEAIPGKYEEMLDRSEEELRNFWDDPESYYEDESDEIYYNFGFNWRDRDNPCLDAYYSPDRRVTGSILASNFGITAKQGDDNVIHITVNNLITSMPVLEAAVEVYDYQLQELAKGTTKNEGRVSLKCDRKPFLVTVTKDKDRNYLKTNDGSALSLSSFDVGGTIPEKGLKAFIFGERDVWRPGDSIYLSVFVRDLKKELPPDHPVEFELLNPLDVKIDNQVARLPGNKLLAFATHTLPDAMTGNYTARIRIGGATFTKRIRIETIKPNRLRLDLSFASALLGGTKTTEKGTLNVKWLNGSPAGAFRTKVEYLLKPVKTEFRGYSQYTFDDPASTWFPETVTIYNSALDAGGRASVDFSPGTGTGAPGMLNAVFTVKVAEPGGDESITQAVWPYAPYPVFAGISLPGLSGKDRLLYTDRENTVDVATVDMNGKPVNDRVTVSVYKLEYKWWWETSREYLGSYISGNYNKPVFTTSLTTSGGRGSFRFTVGREEWGRYLIRVSSEKGHSSGRIVLIDWPWDYGLKGNKDGATLLAVSTDKDKYKPGDEVKVSFPSPGGSTVLVTIENSTGVLEQMNVPSKNGTTEVSFRARPEMAPNVYAWVSIIQPHAQTVNDMPMRLYGVVPVMVEDPETRLHPSIDVADEIRSMKPFVVRVSEQNKKPMSYVLAVVDEGLLDITAFRTPDPWNYFYAREALGVKTWDLYDNVLGAFGGTLDRLFAAGGDETVIDRSAGKAQRFRPVVRFIGPFTLEPGKTNSHAITLPQYTGSVRTMVIAGNDRAFGSAEKAVTVRDPLMVLVTAPRVLSPGDKAALPVTLFINKNGIGVTTIKVATNDLVKADQTEIKITPAGIGEANAAFAIRAGEKTGTAKITVTAEAGGEKAVYEMELPIRSPNPPLVKSETKLLKPGEKWETAFTPEGIEGTNTASVEASAIPQVNFERWSSYLLDYPHLCSEQVTSSAFPQLWRARSSNSAGRVSETATKAVTAAIGILFSRQMISGGIALWPGAANPDSWVTSYAGHFMTEAERLGFAIPGELKQNWIKYQLKASREWQYDDKFRQGAIDQAYRLFTLALAGNPDRGAMNRLRETQTAPALSKWLLAAAYAVSGRPEAAQGLVDVRTLSSETAYSDTYYGNELRDKAVILYTLSLLKKEEEGFSLLREISGKLSSEEMYSTQTLAWCLFSYVKWSELHAAAAGGSATVACTSGGTRTELKPEKGRSVTNTLNVRKGSNPVSFENISSVPVYITLTWRGTPLNPGLVRTGKILSLKIRYSDLSLQPVEVASIKQGSDFMMVAEVSNNGYTSVSNIALTQMIPAGWEIRNTRLYETSMNTKEDQPDYRDIRDDRAATYFSLKPGETKTFILILNAAYAGDFMQPAIAAEAMYSPSFYSGVQGGRVSVRRVEIE